MPEYSNGKIYIIFSTSKKLLYIGSTIQTLSQRLAKHNNDFKYYKLGNRYWVSSYDVLECEDYKIELLENYPCFNRAQLERREGEHIKSYNKDGYTIVNEVVAGRTKQEYYTDNKDVILKKQADYYADNKEDILKQQAEYKATHKEAKAKYDAEYRATHKETKAKCDAEYYKKNKEKIAEYYKKYQKEYRARNKQVSADEPEM